MGVVIDLAAERRKRRPGPGANDGIRGILSTTSVNAPAGPLTAGDLMRTMLQVHAPRIWNVTSVGSSD